jgi:hypothetical protein
VWWGAWLIGNFAAYVSMNIESAGSGADPSIHRASLYLDLAITPISILAAWLAIRITRHIDEKQSERYAVFSQYAAEQQFPPDQYPPPQA